ASGMSTEQLRITWIAVSWLLTYPDEDTLARWSTVRRLVADLPDPARGALLRTIDLLDGRDAVSVQEEDVDTFDTRRRGCLHLTYFSHGDTGRRPAGRGAEPSFCGTGGTRSPSRRRTSTPSTRAAGDACT